MQQKLIQTEKNEKSSTLDFWKQNDISKKFITPFWSMQDF